MPPSNNDKQSENNSTTSMTVFIIITVVYIIAEFYAQYMTEDQADTSKYFLGYLAIVLVVEYGINVSLTKKICGDYQGSTALIATILPWGLIFGSFLILLSALPGWMSPFSNTFGYAAALAYGLEETLNKILLTTKNVDKVKQDELPLHEALTHIYSDRSRLINELTPDNFNVFWKNMKGTFKPNVYDNNGLKRELLSMVGLKHSVAKLVWYILLGVVITSISYDYVIKTSCKLPDSVEKKQTEKYEQELAVAQNNASKTSTKREYVIS